LRDKIKKDPCLRAAKLLLQHFIYMCGLSWTQQQEGTDEKERNSLGEGGLIWGMLSIGSGRVPWRAYVNTETNGLVFDH